MSSDLFKKLCSGGMFGDMNKVVFKGEGFDENSEESLRKPKERVNPAPSSEAPKYPVIRNGKIIGWELI